MTEIRLQSCHVETYMTLPFSICILNESKHLSCQMHRTCSGAHKLQNDTHCVPSQSFHLPLPTHSLCCPTPTVFFDENKHLSSLIVFPLSFVLCILSSLSATFPLALSSYLRLTAPVRASLTSWCLQVCQPSPLNQRRSTLFLPRGSAPSVRARTAWLTATRSET